MQAGGRIVPCAPATCATSLVIADKQGLLRGKRTQVVRGRMPEALVTRAKKRTGIDSDTALIEVALANIAVAVNYADWLLSRRGTIASEAKLEFSEFQGRLRRLKPAKHRAQLTPRAVRTADQHTRTC